MFKQNCLVSWRNPHNSEEEAIEIKSPDGATSKTLVDVLLTSGFRRIASNKTISYFLPCPVGTFTNSSSDGKKGCVVCPPGKLISRRHKKNITPTSADQA